MPARKVRVLGQAREAGELSRVASQGSVPAQRRVVQESQAGGLNTRIPRVLLDSHQEHQGHFKIRIGRLPR